MFFCAALATGLVKSGKVQAISMDRDTYIRWAVRRWAVRPPLLPWCLRAHPRAAVMHICWRL